MEFSIDDEIADLESQLFALRGRRAEICSREASHSKPTELVARLPLGHVPRFSRQMIVPSFGARSQEVLHHLRVLIIGAGGLGCPSALFLAAAGVGQIGVIDDDDVEISNLHRQVAHPGRRCGWSKASSLIASLSAVSPATTTFEAVRARFDPHTAGSLVSAYHVVVDCSDNPATRYVASDACALARRPLVSGAALGTDGQISTYLLRGAPCYRCLHPKPPPPATVSSCADAGVLGPITGVIGSMQALEVLKIASDLAAAGIQPCVRRRGADAAAAADGAAAAASIGSAEEAFFVRCSCSHRGDADAGGDATSSSREHDSACVCPPLDVCNTAAFVKYDADGVSTSTATSAAAAASDPGASASAAGEGSTAKLEPTRGFGSSLAGRLFVFDGAEGRARTVSLRPRRPDCTVCAWVSRGTASSTPAGPESGCGTGEDSSAGGPIRSLDDTAAWLRAHGLIAREGAAAAPALTALVRAAVSHETSGPLFAAPAPPLSPADSAEAAQGGCDRTAASLPTCACDAAPPRDTHMLIPEVTVKELAEARRRASLVEAHGVSRPSALIIDVRSREQFSICSLRGSVNIPLAELKRDALTSLRNHGIDVEALRSLKEVTSAAASTEDGRVFVLCRRGVDSQTATQLLQELGVWSAVNVAGGLQAWTSSVDPEFPHY